MNNQQIKKLIQDLTLGDEYLFVAVLQNKKLCKQKALKSGVWKLLKEC